MRIIDAEPLRNTLMKSICQAEHDVGFCAATNQFAKARIGIGYLKALKDMLTMLEKEQTIFSVVGDNNVNRLRVKEE